MKQSGRDLETIHVRPHPLLLELEQRARADGVDLTPRETSRLLATLVAAMQASRILEIGTGYGDATLWMALAQPRMGRIWTTESDLHRAGVAQSYFQRAGEDDFIEVFTTPALELLENFPHHNLDIAFVDSNPSEYETLLDLLIPTLKLSGLVIFEHADAAAPEFLQRFLALEDLTATVLSTGGGIAIGARRQ